MNNLIAVLLLLQSVFPLNLPFTSSRVTIPQYVHIYYPYAAFGVLKETYDVSSFLKAYQHEVDMKEVYINNTIRQASETIDDPTLSDQEKISYAKLYLSELNRSMFGMLSIHDDFRVKLAERLYDLENNHPVFDSPSGLYGNKEVYYVVLLGYKERTDTLSMSGRDFVELYYKGKPYKSSPVFFTILDMIRNLDPIWRDENEMFYKGHGNVNYGTVR